LTETVDLPTPPLPLVTLMTRADCWFALLIRILFILENNAYLKDYV